MKQVLAEYGYHPDVTIRALHLGTDIHTEYRYDTDRNLTGLWTWLGEAGNGWKRKEEEPGKGDAGAGDKTGCEIQGGTGLWFGTGAGAGIGFGTDLEIGTGAGMETGEAFGTGMLADNTYTYDRNGTMRTKQTLEGLTEYGYNEVSALVKVQYPERIEELFYDKTGNRSRKISDGVETCYTYDACNRLLEVSGENQEILSQYQYDAQGNVIQDERARYTVDAINRVVRAETFDGNIQINRYDAEGLRAEMEENGRISQFVFDGKNVVAEETDEGVIRYIRGERILASDSEHARTYYHYVGDELGSVTHVIKGAEKKRCEEAYGEKAGCESKEQNLPEDRIRNRYVYDAFGNRTVCEEEIANRFGYAGEMYDGVTQQYYLRARFYNPIIGRFTQEDTYYGDGLNLYEYGRNNPVRYIDPSGHEVRAAAEKNYVNRAVDVMNRTADQGVNGMLERVYGGTNGSSFLEVDELVTRDARFLDADGKIDWDKWAPNGGRVPGTVQEGQTLVKGTIIDRYGNQYGKYTSPVGTPYEQRALPYVENLNAYHKYEVLKPIDTVTISEIAEAFEQPGGGIQYELPFNIKQLSNDKFIRRLSKNGKKRITSIIRRSRCAN